MDVRWCTTIVFAGFFADKESQLTTREEGSVTLKGVDWSEVPDETIHWVDKPTYTYKGRTLTNSNLPRPNDYDYDYYFDIVGLGADEIA